MINYTCHDCGEIYLSLNGDYVSENPNASARCVEQAHNEHMLNCESVVERDYTCPDCGEVYLSVNPGYAAEWPNSCSVWIDQEFENHKRFCIGYEAQQAIVKEVSGRMEGINLLSDEAQQAIVKECNKAFGKRTLTRAQFKDAYRLHRLHCAGEGGLHYPCIHYMLSLPRQNNTTAQDRLLRIRRREPRRRINRK